MGYDASRDTIAKIEGLTRWVGDEDLADLARSLGVVLDALFLAAVRCSLRAGKYAGDYWRMTHALLPAVVDFMRSLSRLPTMITAEMIYEKSKALDSARYATDTDIAA